MNEASDSLDRLTGANDPPPLPSERLAIEAIDAMPSLDVDRCVIVSPGRGQSGWAVAARCPAAHVTNFFLDRYRAEEARQSARQVGSNVEVICQTDVPDSPVQLAVLPVLVNGEAELTRELMQQLHLRLSLGGELIATVNHPRDTWLDGQMRALFDKVTRSVHPTGCVMRGLKTRELKRVRDFSCDVVFRDGERLVKLRTRPGVFSHRSLDAAARHLINLAPVAAGDRLLDMGCGSGGVGIALALRGAGSVLALDSHTRAVACTRDGAAANEIDSIEVRLNHDGIVTDAESVDVALLNPPYYGDFRIAQHFIETATRLLRTGGRLMVVTKQPASYLERAWTGLQYCNEQSIKGYDLLTYQKVSSGGQVIGDR